MTINAKFSCRWQSDSLRSQFTNQFLFGNLVSASYLLLTLWKIRSEDTSFKCLHKGMLYSFIQFFLKRIFRSKACLLFWNCFLFEEPIHNFLLFLVIFLLLCGCLPELLREFRICCMDIKQWCWFFISLSDTRLGSYLLKMWGVLGHSLGLQIGIPFLFRSFRKSFLGMQSVLWVLIV